MKQLHSWLGTAAGVIFLGIVSVIATFALLGKDAGIMLFVILLAIGLADVILGFVHHTFSREVNIQYKRRRNFFYVWVIVMSIFIVFGLYMHFTGLQ